MKQWNDSVIARFLDCLYSKKWNIKVNSAIHELENIDFSKMNISAEDEEQLKHIFIGYYIANEDMQVPLEEVKKL